LPTRGVLQQQRGNDRLGGIERTHVNCHGVSAERLFAVGRCGETRQSNLPCKSPVGQYPGLDERVQPNGQQAGDRLERKGLQVTGRGLWMQAAERDLGTGFERISGGLALPYNPQGIHQFIGPRIHFNLVGRGGKPTSDTRMFIFQLRIKTSA